jgi:thiol-disulfide isomerase/thioredoxin
MAPWKVMSRLAMLSAALALSATFAPAPAGPPLAAPGGARIEAVDAAQFRAILEGHRGQVVLVNFWATWCRPCLKEIPELTTLAEKYEARGMRLVAVSLDDPGDLQSLVVPFLERWFPDFHTYIRTTPAMDTMVSVLDPTWNEVLPTSYVLGRDGNVAARLQGGKPAAEFEAAILKALN